MTFNIKCNRCSIKTLNLNDFYMPAETFYLSYANRTLPDKEFNQLEHHIFIKKVKYLDNIVKIEGTLYIGNINESEEVINFQIELKNNKSRKCIKKRNEIFLLAIKISDK